MTVYSLNIDVAGRDVEMLVKSGVVATMETGKHVDKVRTAEHRVIVIVNEDGEKAVAWAQVSAASAGGRFSVLAEGWISEGGNPVGTFSDGNSIKGSLKRTDGTKAKAQEKATFDFDRLACCTSYGSGCYVTCCNGCCSDQTACPGASCCP